MMHCMLKQWCKRRRRRKKEKGKRGRERKTKQKKTEKKESKPTLNRPLRFFLYSVYCLILRER